MPRTRVQQDQHNERRRLVKQEGRKAIFCMRYIHAKYPQIHEEACEFFAMVNQRYPGKRDLTKTSEFKHLKDEPRNMLEPHLEIQLMPNNTNSTPTTIETTTEEEIPPIGDMESEEIERIIKELRQDPDLASVFNDIEVSAYTTVETSVFDDIENPDLPSVFNDMDLQIEFDHLGEDLPELAQEINW